MLLKVRPMAGITVNTEYRLFGRVAAAHGNRIHNVLGNVLIIKRRKEMKKQ